MFFTGLMRKQTGCRFFKFSVAALTSNRCFMWAEGKLQLGSEHTDNWKSCGTFEVNLPWLQTEEAGEQSDRVKRSKQVKFKQHPRLIRSCEPWETVPFKNRAIHALWRSGNKWHGKLRKSSNFYIWSNPCMMGLSITLYIRVTLATLDDAAAPPKKK